MEFKNKIKEIFKSKKGIAIIAVVLVAATALSALTCGGGSKKSTSSYKPYTVAPGTVTTTVVGSGKLAYSSTQDIKISSAAIVEELLVTEGDHVTKGQALARINMVSVKSRIVEIEDALKELDSQIEAAQKGKVSSGVKAGVSGRVKAVYAAKGDDVIDVMIENGALALISLDGLMAVDFVTEAELVQGDKVTVVIGEKEYKGTVEKNYGGACTVTLTDDKTELGASAKIVDGEGNELGSGVLYVHAPFNVVASSGFVGNVNVSENAKVYAATNLFSLTDVDVSAEYEKLLQEREDLVEELNILLQISKTGTISAPCSGVIQTENSNSYAGGEEGGYDYSQFFSMMGGYSGSSAGTPSGASVGEPSGSSLITTAIRKLDKLEELLPAPVVGERPVAVEEEFECDEFKGEIKKWTPEVGYFYSSETSYTAHIELTANEGYRFVYLNADEFYEEVLTELYPESEVNEITVNENGEGNILSFIITFPATGTTEDLWGDIEFNPDDFSSILDQYMGQLGSSMDMSSYLGAYSGLGGSNSFASNELLSTLFTIAADDDMSLSISVDELDILSIELGQTAIIELDAVSGKGFEGTVTKIASSSTSTSGSAKYTVEISIERSEQMRSGMSATAIITVAEKSDVLIIPLEALFESSGECYVYTELDNGELSGKITVTTGISDGINVEILSGLSEGDVIYYTPYMSYMEYMYSMVG